MISFSPCHAVFQGPVFFLLKAEEKWKLEALEDGGRGFQPNTEKNKNCSEAIVSPFGSITPHTVLGTLFSFPRS